MTGQPPEEFEYVVIGSGFGGAVTACRLAQKGFRVLVLERGKPYPPGSFPRTPPEVRQAIWSPDDGLYGMYEMWNFKHLDVVCASGLGGGSLIYANVLVRKDPGKLVHDDWPIDPHELEAAYTLVERMIGPEPLRAAVPKATAFDAAAGQLGAVVTRPPLAVRFARDGDPPGLTTLEPSVHGPVVRSTCRMCGECNVGCNHGAKQTLDFNYLHHAQLAGAVIRTCCEARTIEHVGGPSYRVGYCEHPNQLQRTVIASRGLVLAAGAVGTPRLLLANRAGLPRLSQALGTRVSANGDAIAWVRRARSNGTPRDLVPSEGPVITRSIAFEQETRRGPQRFWIQDAGAPVLGDWLWEALEAPGLPRRLSPVVLRYLRDKLHRRPRDARLGRVLAAAVTEEADAVLPLLAMGLDAPDGRYALNDGRLDLDWRPEPSDAYYDAVEVGFHKMAEALGGKLARFPPRFLHRTTTVHPLGGCPMGRDGHRGVVAGDGHVFGTEGLYVADGSAMPGPVGLNPSFTIAAFAELVAAGMIRNAVPAPA